MSRHRVVHRNRQTACSALMWIGAFVLLISAHALAQDTKRGVPITGDRLSGVVLPIEPVSGAIRLAAARGWSWTVDDTKRLVLQGDVSVSIGGHDFLAGEAVIWLNRLPSAGGLINQIAIYFPKVDDPQKRAGLSVTGEGLLVTGSARGDVTLTTTILENEPAPPSSTVRAAERRLADYLRRLLAQAPTLTNAPQVDAPPKVKPPEPQVGGNPLPPPEEFEPPRSIELPTPDTGPLPIFAPDGRLGFSADSLVIDEGRDAIVAQGSIVFDYRGLDPDGKTLELLLSAERGVIFLRPGALAAMRDGAGQEVDIEQVVGIYLEGHVIATDGTYTVRGNQIYYDRVNNRAIVVDAVLRTYSRDLGRPIYARAKEMQQVAANQWTAEKTTVSMSEFFTPHLSIGAGTVTVTKDPEGDSSRGSMHFDSRDNVLRAGDFPFFYWPRFNGTLDSIPLRGIQTGYRDNDGARIETEWDFFGLTGLRAPRGVDMTLKLDGFTERGPAIGTDFKYDIGPHSGELDLYGLYDHGVDKTSAGLNVDPDKDFRGLALGEHTTRLGRYWTLQGQLSYISDETFISSWRREDFTERREYETSAYLKRQKNNTAFDLLIKDDINGFISNDSILASRSYLVDKLPELTYRRYGDSLFDDIFTYSSEYRATRMRLAMPDGTPEKIGVPAAAFGIDANDDISQALWARGYRSNFVTRGDTRHELSLPRTLGIFEFTPYVAARATGYADDEFEAFSSDSDELRMAGSAGMRIKTTIQRVFNNVENRLFDLHRLRHVIEPYIHTWYGYATVSDDDLPIYDQDVEPLGMTEAVKIGMRNVFQTQRGGPGRWKSVDFLTLDTGAVLNGDDANRRHPVPQFFDWRPEYSTFGDHLYGAGQWLFSDTLAFSGTGIWDLDANEFGRGSAGVQITHSPIFTSFIEYRFLTASDNELLEVGWEYLLTPKYRVSVVPSYDLQAEEFRSLSLSLRRRLPDVDLIVEVTYDQILDETTFSASLGRTTF